MNHPNGALTKQPWRLAELSYAEVKEASYQVAVLPLGATEPHNLHLPYGTDIFEGQTVGDLACQYAHERGARVVLLPTIPFGTETNLREFPLAININPSTLNLIVSDIVQSLVNSGIQKIVLLNSHGGNELKPLLRELYGQTSAHLFLCNWFQAIRDVCDGILEHPDDHAGEMETSFALAYFGHLVMRQPDGSLAADAGAKRPSRFHAINQGWVSISRPWHLLTTHSGAGNPHAASAVKGEKLVQAAASRLGDFLVELSSSELDPYFPFSPDSA